MPHTLRTSLLLAAAALMIFGAVMNAIVMVPDLHGDLVEIGVRPSVLGATIHGLYFGAMAMFVCTAIVLTAAYESMRGLAPARMPLVFIAAAYIVSGSLMFARSHNPHHLGPVLMGALVIAALVIPKGR